MPAKRTTPPTSVHSVSDGIESELRYRSLVEQIQAITYVADWAPDAPLRFVSPQIERLLGFPPEDWVTDRALWSARLHPDDRERVLAGERRAHAEEAELDAEYRMIAADGSVVWFWERAAIVRDAPGRPAHTQGVMVDITARKLAEARLEEAEAELRRLAFHDPLTGLPNRSQLDARLRAAVARARRRDRAVALLFVDLDNFKLVNDSLGHVAGDRLLRRVATRLGGVEEPGGLLARHGGDEFLVLLDDLEPDDRRDGRARGRRRHRGAARQAVPDRRAPSSTSRRASASRCSPATPTARTRCSSTPTPRCTRARAAAARPRRSTRG